MAKHFKITSLRRNYWFWLVGVIGIILDQLTKYWVVQSFPQVNDTIPLIPKVFHLTYIVNTGAAFSFFRGGAFWLRWLSLGVSLGLIALGWLSKLNKIEQLAYGFILAGAFGNGIDRFLFGHVVDFLDFRLINFPVFNLADVCINIGLAFLFLTSFFSTSPKKDPDR